MKISVSEWIEFEANGWPEGYVWSDESTLDDGTSLYNQDTGAINLPTTETFVVPRWWSTHWEGPDGKQIDTAGDGFNIRSLIRKWRKARDTETFVVSVPKDQAEAFRAECKAKGWTPA